jgi:hypothetical protein
MTFSIPIRGVARPPATEEREVFLDSRRGLFFGEICCYVFWTKIAIFGEKISF